MLCMKSQVYFLFLFLSLITHPSYAGDEYKDPIVECAKALGVGEELRAFYVAREAFLRRLSHDNVDKLTKTYNDLFDKSKTITPDTDMRLHEAVRAGNLLEIPDLVSNDVSLVNALGQRGARPLSIAAAIGDINAIDLLLSLGADINAPDAIGNSPLIYAVGHGQAQAVEHLLDKGADINLANLYRESPLIYAVVHGHQSIFRSLAAHGAFLKQAQDRTFKTILHRALIHPSTPDRVGMVETILDTVTDWPEIINWPEPVYGGTPLHWAAIGGYFDVIYALLERGARLDVRNKEGEYPIHVAARANQKEAFAALMYANSILLYHDDNKGRNVMETARAHNSQEVLLVLSQAPFLILERPVSE